LEPEILTEYLLHLADDALILGHRNSEWCGHGPVLEQDIALTNISLDLIGQGRNFYQYAALTANQSGLRVLQTVTEKEFNEDSLAYLRDTREFRNCLLVEQTNGDWARTILRQFLFSSFQYLLYSKLQESRDSVIAGISAKALKEVTYHMRWSGEWVIRLGDGTEESRQRIMQVTKELWTYTGELFVPTDYEKSAAVDGIGANLPSLKNEWNKRVSEVFHEATLPQPSVGREAEQLAEPWMQTGGKTGLHSEHLGLILTELQFMQRAYPGCEW
jgi:ring-1,2-phenylacetyl-CoA epoxidase subunit PaaC